MPKTGNLNVVLPNLMGPEYLTAKDDVVDVKIVIETGTEGLDQTRTGVQHQKLVIALDLIHSSKNKHFKIYTSRIFYSVKVFELYPPQLLFNISISLSQKEYTREDGTEIWVDKATFYIGPQRRSVVSPSFQV